MIGDYRYRIAYIGGPPFVLKDRVDEVDKDGSEWTMAYGERLLKRLTGYYATEAEAWAAAYRETQATVAAVVAAAKEAGHAVVADGGAPGGGAGDVG